MRCDAAGLSGYLNPMNLASGRMSTDTRREVLIAINLSNRPFFGFTEAANATNYIDITPDVGPPWPPERHRRSGRTKANRELAGSSP